jgi:trimeric autotransporter adhesin
MNKFLSALVLVGLIFSGYVGSAQHIVISEVYGGGGNSGATYKNDFIELYNPTTAPVSLIGWSVQYASAAGTTWVVTSLTGSIAAKGYYLIQEAVGAGGTVNLPSPNATGTIAMSATAGKVALVNVTTALSGANPTGASLIDLVGYGTTATGFEGATAPAPSNTASIERKANSSSTAASMGSGGADEFLGNGQDSNNNSSDFIVRSPQPQNSASPLEPIIVDTTPPTFITGFPASATILQSQFDLVVQLDEIGTAYYVVIADGAIAPASSQVKAGQDNNGAPVSLSGSLSVPAANATSTKTITGFTSATSYDVYVVAEDAIPNLQSSPVKIDVTSASPAPVIIPSLSSISFPGFTDKSTQSAPQTYTVSASDLTNDVALSVTGNFLLSLDNANYSSSLSIVKTLFATAQTIYVKFNPSGNMGVQTATITHSSVGAANKTVTVSATAIDSFNQNFNDPAFLTNSGWRQYSKVGAQVWASTNFGRTCLTGCNAATVDKAVQINGFSSGAKDNEDWLISPLLDMTGFANFPALSFWTISAFSGDGLQLKYSSNYTGSGDPTLATWTSIDGKFPASNSAAWTKSSNVILPKSAIYIAIVYTSNTTAASRWTFDDWQVADVASYIDVPAIAFSFGEISAGNSSASKNFSFKSIGYGDVTVTAPTGYEVSLDNSIFSTSQLVASADATVGKIIYVRFAPPIKQLKWDGTLNFKGTGLDASYGTLTGTSYPKAETFDIVTYNLEFFGTDVKNTSNVEFGPTDDALQISNVTTVMQTINADIYGVEEVADDNALNTLVSNLTGYDKIVSDRWSYSFIAPDPNFPPQKIGFIYNTSKVQVVNSRVMFEKLYDDVRAGNTSLLPGYPTSGGNTPANFWSSGRLPFMVTFDVTINGFKKRIRVIDIHAKSGSAQADYDRRKYDVKVLHDSLVANYANDNIILVGDYNDDVDVSIGAPTNTESTFKVFVDDAANFNALTYSISQAGAVSFPNSSSFLDHIITSNELTDPYIPNSIAIEDARTYISNYINTTSDHLPVSARFLLSVKTDQTITFNSLPAKTFGDSTLTLSANSTSGLPISFSSSDATIASVSGNTVTILKAGTVNIVASQVGDGSYNAANDVVQSLAINKANQTITFHALPAKTFGDTAFSIPATSSSDLPVSLVSSDSTIVSISGNTVTILKTGVVTITASQRGDGNYNPAADMVQSLIINKADQVITFNALAANNYGDPAIALTATSSSGLTISYSSSNTLVAIVSDTTATIVGVGATIITASQAGDSNYNAAVDVQQTLTVNKGTPSIEWGNPSDIVYGTALSAAQLNATASLAGMFTYSPENGTVLNSGGGQTLSATFTPADSTNYNTASKQVTINVSKATPSIAWSNPLDIVYGTALNTTQLNATANILGSFAYSPDSGTVLNAGDGQALSVTFMPANDINYNTITKQVTINVSKVTPSITWSNPFDIVYGTALGATQLNATAGVAGTFAYSPDSGTVLNAGSGQALSVTFMPKDGTNYNTATMQVTINVGKATQALTFAPLGDKTIGDVFLLTATASSNLTVSYTAKPSNKIIIVGNQVTTVKAGHVTITASQAGDANYYAATSVDQSFHIKPAKPKASASNASSLISNATSGNPQLVSNGVALGSANSYAIAPASMASDLPGFIQTITAYPNPADDRLVIVGLQTETRECTVVDMLGHATTVSLTKHNGGHEASVQGFSAGVYLVRVQQLNSVQQIKFVKK